MFQVFQVKFVGDVFESVTAFDTVEYFDGDESSVAVVLPVTIYASSVSDKLPTGGLNCVTVGTFDFKGFNVPTIFLP